MKRLFVFGKAGMTLLVCAAPAFCQLGAFGASPGSLYAPSGRLADATRDLRANQAGDVVTIIVNESASAVASGVSNSSRKSTATNQIGALAGTVAATNPLANLLDLSGAQDLKATGQTSRALTLSTTISAHVVEVTPNGLLIVEGIKNVGVNSEHQTVTVRGMVRPADLTTANTVLSNLVADLQIQVNGKGVVGDAIRRPNFLYRMLLGLLPF
ncbi:MAG: flagellar basal body L-ring protein FlgH [Bryobacteraceae bacterium]